MVEEDTLPEELKNLIEESVQDVAEPAEITKLKSKAVKGSQLLEFVNSVIERLGAEDAVDNMRNDLNNSYKGNNPSERMIEVRKQVEKIYDEIWTSMGVSIELGQRAVSGIPNVMKDVTIDSEFRTNLTTGVKKYKSLESEVVGRLLFGDSAYKQRQEQQKVILEKKKVLEKEFAELGSAEKGKRVKELKEKAFALKKKLMTMGGSAAAKYLRELKEEEEAVMMELSALALMIQEGASNLPEGIGPPKAKQCCNKH